MNDELVSERVEKVTALAQKLCEKPERWGWTITAVLYGHNKVVVQCVSDKGTPLQFTGKVE